MLVGSRVMLVGRACSPARCAFVCWPLLTAIIGGEFATLADGRQLKDEVVNEIARRLAARTDAQHIKLLGSHFLAHTAPLNPGVQPRPTPVEYWHDCDDLVPRRDLSDVQYVCAFHHVPGHWCFACLDIINRRFDYRNNLDSHGRPQPARIALCKYVALESSRQPGTTQQLSSELFVETAIPTPTQPDGVSCGCCALMRLEALIDGTFLQIKPDYTCLGVSKWRAQWLCALLEHTTTQDTSRRQYNRATVAAFSSSR